MRYLTKLLLHALLFCLASFARLAYADGPYHGKVIDAETKQPIAGAAVLAVWWERSPGIVNVNISYYDAQETLTDVDGNYTVPGMVITSIDPKVTIEPKFTIYKPRYKALRQSTLKPLPQPPGTPDKYRIQYPFLNHFHNPLRTWNSPLPFPLGFSSIIWGQGTAVSNEFQWQNARVNFFNGLVASTLTERQRLLALTFRTLGQQIHLVQDAACPSDR